MITPRIPWTVSVIGALVLALLFTVQNYFVPARAPRGWSLGEVFLNQVLVWGIWLVLLPVIFRAAHALRRRPGAPLSWLAQAGVAVTAALLHAVAAGVLRWTTGIAVHSSLDDVLKASVVNGFAWNLLRYALIAAACHAVLYHYEVRERDARAARLEAGAAEARLESLRARLHPHFLFNTLNSISALIPQNAAAAQAMVEQLADLLRASLSGDARNEIPLGDEIALVRQYIGIEKMRFQERLEVVVDVPRDLERALVPQLILQPLVENAIRHGIAPLEQGGLVAIRASAADGALRLMVQNSPPAAAAESTAGTGFGLHSTRSRLEHLFGERATFATETSARGTMATIELPLRFAREYPAGDRVA